ncbi:hypothetical protein RJ639_031829 [Escallonia herrerae]|uniref:Expansin n=1 Tax=Escallonia herrerae TaxID=1293975 RepID=A0AA88X130_9ASTE|nr:hypothetical protein RJ639_031829 [Escallonia herrerae]
MASFTLWHSLFLVGVALEGSRGVHGWLSGHATFYGAGENPTTLDITMATSETIPESGPNYILNGLDNALYNVYSPMVNAKALWESLERKYKTEDAGSKKFVVGKFLDFKMVDSKTVISQVQEFQLILHDIHAEGMHKRKEMKLEDLIVRLRIEEDNRQSEKKAGNYHQEAKANVVEQGGACGYDNTFHAGFGVNTAAVSGALFRRGEACGACYQVRCDYRLDPKWCLRGAVLTITANNFCPPNNNLGWCNPPLQHLDMSMPAFLRIARQGNEGIIPVVYRRYTTNIIKTLQQYVSQRCRQGGVRFTLKGQSNFNMVMFSNVGGSGDIKNAWIRGSKARTWLPMHRNWGANWQSNADLRNQILSFRLNLVDGKTVTFFNVVPSSWKFGQTFASQNQFS